MIEYYSLGTQLYTATYTSYTQSHSFFVFASLEVVNYNHIGIYIL